MKNWIVLTLLFCGCAPTYVPNVRNSPLFTKGGEVQGSFQMGNGLDAQAAISVSPHIGLMANYNYANRERFDPDDYDDYHRHQFFEGGVGYFTNDAAWCVEVFAGYGRGEASSKNEFMSPSSSKPSSGKYERYFFQPAFGLNKKTVHVAFVPRFSMVNFTAYSEGQVSFFVKENPKFFFEPAVMGRVNFANNHMFFTFQGGYSTSMSNDVYFSHRRFQMSTGLGFRFGGIRSETGIN